MSVYISRVNRLLDSILYVPSTIFQLCKDRSSWVEPVLSYHDIRLVIQIIMYNGFLSMKIAFDLCQQCRPLMKCCIQWYFICLTLCMLGNSSTLLFSKYSFRNKIRECQTAWIQIRPDILSGLIWVQAICKTLLHSERSKLRFNSERNRVNP